MIRTELRTGQAIRGFPSSSSVSYSKPLRGGGGGGGRSHLFCSSVIRGVIMKKGLIPPEFAESGRESLMWFHSALNDLIEPEGRTGGRILSPFVVKTSVGMLSGAIRSRETGFF